jgi:nicotinamidase-related amidase/flavin-binding protein dodecin
MTDNPNELTIDNSALVLIDHQPWVAFPVQSIDRTVLVNNLAGLARAARALGVPTVLTTVGANGSVLADPLLSQIGEVFPEITPIDRTSTNAWSDPNLRAAVEATGRRKLIMAGVWTEVCLAQTVLAALKDGFEVYFVSDSSGGTSEDAHEDAKVRMIQAGAKPISWIAVISEWTPDYTSPERQALTPVILQHGGGVSLSTEYLVAQMTAGVVPTPAFAATDAWQETGRRETGMANSAYRITALVGTSIESWERAAQVAFETAAGTLGDLRMARIVGQAPALRT